MKALVLCGTGGMVQGVARDLINQEQITKVILGDINTDPNRVQEKLRSSTKVSLVKVDVNDHAGMVSTIKKVDVVINCADPFYKTAMAEVEVKVNYIDICDDYEAAQILFASDIDKTAKDAGITVLTGIGSDTGTNNVLVNFFDIENVIMHCNVFSRKKFQEYNAGR